MVKTLLIGRTLCVWVSLVELSDYLDYLSSTPLALFQQTKRENKPHFQTLIDTHFLTTHT